MYYFNEQLKKVIDDLQVIYQARIRCTGRCESCCSDRLCAQDLKTIFNWLDCAYEQIGGLCDDVSLKEIEQEKLAQYEYNEKEAV